MEPCIETNLYMWSSDSVLGGGSWKPLSVPTLSSCRPLQKPLRLVTYNIWFDAILKGQRATELIRILQEQDPDVICLQEVTPSFDTMLRDDKFVRKNWIMSALGEQQSVTQCWYGTMVLAKKTLVKCGWSPRTFFSSFPGTECGRGLLLLELKTPLGLLNIGNIHFELNEIQRASQIRISRDLLEHSALDSGVPSIASVLCGDTNIFKYSEVDTFLTSGYQDARLTTVTDSLRLDPSSIVGPSIDPSGVQVPIPDDLIFVAPTYGRFGVQIRSKRSKERVVRLDLVLYRGLQVHSCVYLGDQPLSRKALKGTGADKDEDVDIYPSDHLGVRVDVVFKST